MAAPIRIWTGTLGTTINDTLTTVPAGETWVMTHVVFMGISSGAAVQYVEVFNGASVRVMYRIPVAFGDTVQIDTKIVMPPTASLQAFCQTGGTVAAHFNGVRA